MPKPSTEPLPGPGTATGGKRRTLLIRAARSHRPLDPDHLVLELGGRGQASILRGDSDRLVDEGTELRLELDDNCLSGHHALLRCVVEGEQTAWQLEDLGSRNGTWINGKRLSSPRRLTSGDLIEVGQTFWKFWVGDPGDPDAQPSPETAGSVVRATYSPDLHEILRRAERVAQSDLPLILHGESGTGKEVMAKSIHTWSGRKGPYAALNCAAIPETLIESELFGHERGAFTGAERDRAGVIESAEGGTLLLDEIGDMPLAAQAKLLRVLQEKRVFRLGATGGTTIDVRFVAATHRNLRQLVEEDRFRGDLYARINGFVIELPPLRHRMEDLGLLLAQFLEASGGADQPAFSHDAMRCLFAYTWPFNIRELEKAVAVAVALAGTEEIQPKHLPDSITAPATDSTPPRAKGEAQRGRLERALREHHGNIAAVARALETTRSQVHRLLKRYEIDPAVYRS